jgi:hypothetical protein
MAQQWKHCTTCGQKLADEAAAPAADPDVAYCCECGRRLDDEQKCSNSLCPYYRTIPDCK